jgi:DNA-binding NtrC family response regulator
VARALHHYSPRKEHPFVDLLCAALPMDMVESELFGYERGAFPGATQAKAGLLEAAHRGTLFLDEVGALDMRLQSKLLRVMETGRFYRLGAVKQSKVDVRIVAAANPELHCEVAAGRLLKDLYQRLEQGALRIPPLRKRPEEIAPLAKFFLAQQNPELQLAADALGALYSYSWPGNVRELRNTVLRSALQAKGPLLHADDLIFRPRNGVDRPIEGLSGAEAAVVGRAMEDALGVRQRAAAALGMSRSTLSRKLKRYGISPGETAKAAAGRQRRSA